VRAARVHLVLPRRQPFSHDVQPAQASVVLTMSGAARLDQQGVQAVLNLVAAAVPGLKPQGIAIIDSRGNLLARAGQPTGEQEVVQTAEELHHATELRLSRAVEEMLEQSLGPGRVRAEAAVTMNYDRVNETSENFNPDQQVVRSTQSTTDKSNSTEAEKNVSVANNLPNADAGGAQNGSKDEKQEETTNYEIGKTVRTLVREQPQIARISLAVMVDGDMQPGKDGKAVWTGRGPEDLARIKRLVQSAIGYDEKRGDTVEVQSMRFAMADEAAAPASNGLFGLGLEKADILSLAQSAILAVVVLLALLFVLRPMALRLSAAMPGGLLGSDPLLVGADGVALALPDGSGGGGMGMIGGGGGAAMLTDESMVNVQNIEGQVRASAMRKLTELVEQHPEASLSIMRSWMTADET
jgi:flagellar M-ring protein FliF